uniref:Putative mitochondrial ATP synthase delta chain n=1 Tax=Pinctada fucata TaxID=50426 RepID=A0A194AMP7_PINFU
MALFLPLSNAPRLMRQCSRVVTTQLQASRNYADMPLTFASPSEVFFKEENVRQIDATTLSSTVGILPNHVPMLGVLKPGVVRVVVDESVTRNIFVSSGSLTVNPDGSVQILAEEATDVANLDAAAAERDSMLLKTQHQQLQRIRNVWRKI